PSCSTVAWDTGFTQSLSNKLGVDVLAPTDIFGAYSNGKMVVTPISATGDQNLEKQGGFKVLTPGGNDAK
ncbi:TPA: hypothetical protein RY451_004520, partial [Escherichia albertii]|nr:hypothetical protein [Escherichia albertii]